MTPKPADAGKKICKMCGMEIPKPARKCPFCHHFQNRSAMLFYHPAFLGLYACFPMVVILIAFSYVFSSGENFDKYQNQIAVADSRIAFGDTKSGPTVAVIGTLKNNSSVSWRNLDFHVDFFDAQGKRSNVEEHEDSSSYLAGNGTSSFKLSFRKEFPDADYVKCEVRVVTATDVKARF